MKVVAINGSARRDGNTDKLISEAFRSLEDADVECEVVGLAGLELHGCKACWSCGGRQGCVFGNDSFNEIFEKMKTADGIILASPVYTGNISASLQAVLERAAVVCDMNRDARLLSGKAGGCLAVARRGGALNTLDVMANFFLLQDMFVAGSTYWPIAYGQMPGDVMEDVEGIETARRLGENMTLLLGALGHE